MDFLSRAEALFSYTQALRRDFHMHPELGFQEVRTAGIVARELRELGLEVTTGVAETGVVALLEGERPGPVVLLRVDMDALPVTEQNQVPYASQTPGVMHACGHDGHTAIGLTVARLLHEARRELAGTVKLVFQPAEEGLGGAERMVAEGVLQNPRPDVTLGLHLWNELPLGQVGMADGPIMSASEIFKVTIHGKGGHGGAPHRTADPVVAAAQAISALQTIVARNVGPLESSVVSVTTIHGGEAFNVIPPAVAMSGTIRTLGAGVRRLTLERFESIFHGVAESLGCRAEIDVQRLTPALMNDAAITARVRQVARQTLPASQVETSYRTMVSEDMAYFMDEVPGCYVLLGSANAEQGLDYGHHHPRFDFDERALPRAAALLAASAAEFLKPV